MFLHDELSEIALVCQSIPRALQYICYTIDTIFLDGLNDADDDALSHFSDPSMQVSAEPKKPRLALGDFYMYIYVHKCMCGDSYKLFLSGDDHNEDEAHDDGSRTISSVNSMEGKEIDAVSEATMQTIDLDYQNTGSKNYNICH